MAKRRRLRRDWPAVLQAQADSGLSVRDFCRQQGVSASLVHRWRQRCQVEPGTRARDRFVELRSADSRPVSSGVSVVTKDGWCLEVEPGFGTATLERVPACVRPNGACSP